MYKTRIFKKMLAMIVFVALLLLILFGCTAEETTAEETTAEETTAEETTAEETTIADDEVEVEAITSVEMGIDCSIYSREFPSDSLGNEATSAEDITLTDEEIAEIKTGGYKAALLWGASSEWYNAASRGIKSVFDELNIEIIHIGDCQYDQSKQATEVETVLAMDPDVIIAIAVDPISAAQAFQPVVDKGKVLVLDENHIEGYSPGDQYVSIVSGNTFQVGRQAAELINEVLGGKGEIGFIYYDEDFLITNGRDFSFFCDIQQNYPDIKIVAANGFVEERKAGEAASVMLQQHPEIDAIYVDWAIPAEGVVEAIRNVERSDIKVVTVDLEVASDLDMVMDGPTYGKISDSVFDLGVALGRLGGYGLLSKEAPPYVVVEPMQVTKDNVVEAWELALGIEPPAEILDILGQ